MMRPSWRAKRPLHPLKPVNSLESTPLEPRVLLERDGVIAVDKPFNLPTSGRSLDDEDCLQFRLMQRHGGMVWAVHQLDADTSGINLFTIRKSLVEPLKRALSAPAAAKRYLAVLHGRPRWTETICRAPLGPIDGSNLGVTADGRAACSHFRVQDATNTHALVEVRIETGRTHQIRIHANHLGHPLVGEEWYRDPPCTLHGRQALHAWRLELRGPVDLDLEAPIPSDLDGLLVRLGLHADCE